MDPIHLKIATSIKYGEMITKPVSASGSDLSRDRGDGGEADDERGAGESEGGEREEESGEERHWEEVLTEAQQTLVNRDIFLQLAREAVGTEERICIVQGDWLAVSLGQGYLLKVYLIHGPASAPQPESSLGEQMPRIPRPASLPLHMGRPPGLPPSKRPRINAGPKAFDWAAASMDGCWEYEVQALAVEEREVVEEGLLGKLVQMTEHYLLTRRALALLSRFGAECEDPHLLWNWVESSPTFSILKVQIATPNCEYFPRSSFYLELTRKGVSVVSGGGETIALAPDLSNLHDMLWVQCRSHQLLELRATVQGSDWRPLYATSASASLHATLLPTLLAANQSGTKAVCIRLPLRADPEIFLQTSLKNGAKGRLEGLVSGEEWRHLRGDFQSLAYPRLLGSSLPHKVEILLAALNTTP